MASRSARVCAWRTGRLECRRAFAPRATRLFPWATSSPQPQPAQACSQKRSDAVVLVKMTNFRARVNRILGGICGNLNVMTHWGVAL